MPRIPPPPPLHPKEIEKRIKELKDQGIDNPSYRQIDKEFDNHCKRLDRMIGVSTIGTLSSVALILVAILLISAGKL